MNAELYAISSGGNIRRIKKPHKALARRVRKAVYERDNFTCQICGYRPRRIPKDWDGSYSPGNLSLDHVVPYRDGGEFTEANLQALCLTCNGRKGARV